MKIKIAVLSDLHISKKNYDIQNKVFNNIINHIDNMVIDGDYINLVLVTGDITFSGESDEFELANKFFKQLQLSLDLPSRNFIFIPGNHDYNMDDIGQAFKNIKDINLKLYNKIFNDDDFQIHIKKAFKNYNNFLRNFYGKIPPLTGHSTNFPFPDFNVNVSLINSSLGSTIGNGKQPLFIDTNKIKTFIPQKNEKELSIFLMHHPISCLNIKNKHQITEILTNSCDILLCGHEHLPDYKRIEYFEGDEYIYIINGCTCIEERLNPDNFSNRFLILEYDITNTLLKIIPWITKDDMNFCGRDTTLYSKAKDDGTIEMYLNSKSSKIDVKLLEDPLGIYELPEILDLFFKKSLKRICSSNNKKALLDLRRELKDSQNLNLNLFSQLFLKYMLKRNLFENYEELQSSLEKYYIFSLIKGIHEKILVYYDYNYFKNLSHKILNKFYLLEINFMI